MTKNQTQNLWDISILPFCNFSKNEKAPSGPGPTHQATNKQQKNNNKKKQQLLDPARPQPGHARREKYEPLGGESPLTLITSTMLSFPQAIFLVRYARR